MGAQACSNKTLTRITIADPYAMKVVAMASMLLLGLSTVSIASADDDSEAPIAKVISMIGDLESKLIKEGEGEQKVYEEFSDWCGDKSVDLGREIKQGKSEVAELKATIFEQT